ncbi:MAG TPA: hypothetical protein VHQ22_22885 [Terriglobales bacterium]|nr:hypothetical protein [Terriglobales bacterium]
MGLTSKRSYRQWMRAEQHKLLDLIASHSLYEVTTLLLRSPSSVRTMLHRLGANARMGEDWFTKHALARGLHIRGTTIGKRGQPIAAVALVGYTLALAKVCNVANDLLVPLPFS